ncbi:MAG: hypothetical protein H0T68_10390 [Gemmatimonadales bacterium]|nr:hypothetical protein [Gemmatimonadales bacterium]
MGPLFAQVLATGRATWADDHVPVLDRHGYLEAAYFTYSHSAIRLDSTVHGIGRQSHGYIGVESARGKGHDLYGSPAADERVDRFSRRGESARDGHPRDSFECLGEGQPFLQKPVPAEILLEMIRGLLAEGAAVASILPQHRGHTSGRAPPSYK